MYNSPVFQMLYSDVNIHLQDFKNILISNLVNAYLLIFQMCIYTYILTHIYIFSLWIKNSLQQFKEGAVDPAEWGL